MAPLSPPPPKSVTWESPLTPPSHSCSMSTTSPKQPSSTSVTIPSSAPHCHPPLASLSQANTTTKTACSRLRNKPTHRPSLSPTSITLPASDPHCHPLL